MALYDTPWGQRELPEDEANELRGQVGADAITEVTGSKASAPAGVASTEGPNPTPEGK
jgi:hypothetical protein